jgi:hypothetical protein
MSNPRSKKKGHTFLSKILAISSNPHTIMLLLILRVFGCAEQEASKIGDLDGMPPMPCWAILAPLLDPISLYFIAN